MDESNNLPVCAFCPETMADKFDDLRKMPMNMLRIHTAVCHVGDMKKSEKDDHPVYVCDGNGERLCKVPYKTAAVNNYVDHMKIAHPNEEIPSNIRYKAALSDLMAELSNVNGMNDASDSDTESDEDLRKVLNFVLKPKTNANSTSDIDEDSDDDEDIEVLEEMEQIDDPPLNESTIEVASATNETTSSNLATIEEQSELQTDRLNSDGPTSNPIIERENTTTTTATNDKAKRNGRFLFTSNEYYQMNKKLTNRYKKGSKIKCKKCSNQISVCMNYSFIQHGMDHHMIEDSIECRLCEAKFRTHKNWHIHFNRDHPNSKKQIIEDGGFYSNFFVDKRPELEKEIIQAVTECFLSNSNSTSNIDEDIEVLEEMEQIDDPPSNEVVSAGNETTSSNLAKIDEQIEPRTDRLNSDGPTSNPIVEHENATTTTAKANGKRGELLFTSNEYYQVNEKLKNRYKKGSKIKCKKCLCHIAGGSSWSSSIMNHAMEHHMVEYSIECRLCEAKLHSLQNWHLHFNRQHSNSKRRGSFSEFYVDKRPELEKEIIQAITECFLS